MNPDDVTKFKFRRNFYFYEFSSVLSSLLLTFSYELLNIFKYHLTSYTTSHKLKKFLQTLGKPQTFGGESQNPTTKMRNSRSSTQKTALVKATRATQGTLRVWEEENSARRGIAFSLLIVITFRHSST